MHVVAFNWSWLNLAGC